jgi:hypothetical protein
MKNKSFYILFIIYLLQTSCKTAYFFNDYNDKDIIEYINKSLNNAGLKNFSADLEIKIIDDVTKTVFSKIYLEKGRFIYTNGGLFGVELFRAEVSPDSVKYINRLDKTYLFSGNEDLDKLINFSINYKIFESLILHGFYMENEQKKKIGERILELSDSYEVKSSSINGLDIVSYLNKIDYRIDSIRVTDKNGLNTAFIMCSDYLGNERYPSKFDIRILHNNIFSQYQVLIKHLEHDKIKSRSFQINGKYKEIKL